MGDVKTKVQAYEAMLAKRNAPPADPLAGNQLGDPLKSPPGQREGEGFQVFCRTASGKTVVVGDLTPAMTVPELHAAVAAKTGESADSFSLTFDGKPLRGDHTLGAIGIGRDRTIEQRARLQGGYGERS